MMWCRFQMKKKLSGNFKRINIFDCFFSVLESIHLYQRYKFHNKTDRERESEKKCEYTEKTVMNGDNVHAYRCELT